MIVGYSYGVWDLLHVGHVRQLEEARKHCDYLVVGVFTDEVAESFKRRPIISEYERAEMVIALKCVDQVVIQCSIDPTDMLEQEGVDILFHGDDWDTIPGAEYMESTGGKVITPPYTKSVSTSGIIKLIRERYEKDCGCSCCGVEGRR